jgi:murein DD-endopeptidase MepM/ murein hydrolase activator NlpD
MKRLLLFFILQLSVISLLAQNVPAVPASQLPLDSTAVDSEGDELEELDDIEVHTSGIPEWLTSHFSNDTLYIACDYEALPHKLVVHTNNADIVYKIAPRYMLGDTTLMNHHPADSIYRFIWTDERVNPYGTMFDSLKGDIHIPMAGFRLPAPGYVTSQFGWRRYRMHKGTDIKVQVGDSIRAAWGGQVRIVGWDPRGYGYFVVMRHDNGLETVYGHLSRPLVDEYEKVPAGYVIGLGGNTGRSTGSHLHLEIRYLGEAINPENLINFATGELRNKEEYVIGVNAMKKVRAEQAAMKYHKVRSGDTLSGIARKYGTTVRKLCQLNKIKETKILQIGQKIRVR